MVLRQSAIPKMALINIACSLALAACGSAGDDGVADTELASLGNGTTQAPSDAPDSNESSGVSPVAQEESGSPAPAPTPAPGSPSPAPAPGSPAPTPSAPPPSAPPPASPPPAGPPSATYTALLAQVTAMVNRRGSSWISDVNGSPCTNPSNTSALTVVDGYNRLPAFYGLASAFEANSNPSYVQMMYDMAVEYIDAGQDHTGDGWNDWYSCYKPGGWNHDHYEWRAAAGIGLTLTLLLDNPSLALSTSSNKAKLANFLRDHVWAKWQPGNIAGADNLNTNASYFISRIGIVVMALDQAFPGTAAYSNWLQARGTALTNMLSSNIDVSNGACNVWGRVTSTDVAASPTPGTVDGSHAGPIAAFLTGAKSKGYSFVDQSDISCLAASLNKVMWTGPSGFYQNVNGTGPVNNGTSKAIGGWFTLLPYSPQNKDAYASWALNSSTFTSAVSYENRLAVLGALLSVF